MLLLTALEPSKVNAVGSLLVSYIEVETWGRAYALKVPF